MNTYRVLVTGSRDWEDAPTLVAALEAVFDQSYSNDSRLVVVQGGAAGADIMARRWANWKYGVDCETYEAEWRPHGIYNPQAGLVRNRLMVNLGADLCLAFIRGGSRGATHCAQLAEEAGIPVRRFEVSDR